jgi:hypothetical protein
METKIKKFLEFNGKTIFFVDVNGTNWIAIKPICEAIGVDFEAQRKALKRDKLLNGVPSNQTVHDASNRLQKMLCLPEKYIYGWIFRIQTSNEDILPFQQKCYDILFDYFHGTITKRKEFLSQRNDIDARLYEINLKLKEENELIQERNRIINEKKLINISLRKLDSSLFEEKDLFSDLN